MPFEKASSYQRPGAPKLRQDHAPINDLEIDLEFEEDEDDHHLDRHLSDRDNLKAKPTGIIVITDKNIGKVETNV